MKRLLGSKYQVYINDELVIFRIVNIKNDVVTSCGKETLKEIIDKIMNNNVVAPIAIEAYKENLNKFSNEVLYLFFIDQILHSFNVIS